MKIINNQNILLINEVNDAINAQSKVYLSCNHFTAFALFELIESLKKVIQVQIMLSIDLSSEDDFRLIHAPSEKQLEFALDRKSKINEVVSFLKDKIEIRQGSLGNQNILIIENNGTSQCFMLTPLNLDSLCLGVVNSQTPIFINSFEDSSNQYLSLFNNIWSNSKSFLNDSIIQRLHVNSSDIDHPIPI